MTRARAKLLGQQVNSLLIEYDVCDNENFILPKSMHLCMIRVVDNTNVDGGLEEQQGVEYDVPNGAREEWEACARGEEQDGDARKEPEEPAPSPVQPAGKPAEHQTRPVSSPVSSPAKTGQAPEAPGRQPGQTGWQTG